MRLLVLLLLGFTAAAASAQTIITPSGNQTVPLEYYVSDPTSTTFQYYNNYSYTIGESAYALSVFSSAGQGQSSGGIADFTNNSSGAISLINNAAQATWNTVLKVQALGGTSNSNANGGTGGAVTAYNYAGLTANGLFPNGLTLFDAGNAGGNGINDGTGEDGGPAGLVSIFNYAAVKAGTAGYVQVATGLRGISGSSQGGNAGDSPNGHAGASAGSVTIANSGEIDLYWTATNTTGTTSIYGIVGSSTGGNGSAATDNEKSGGAAGAGNGVSITHENSPIRLTGNAGIAPNLVTGAAIAALVTGGNGGNAYGGSGSDQSYAGAGGMAAYGSTTQVTVTNSNLTVDADYINGILARNTGGIGGSAAENQDHSIPAGGGSTGTSSVTVQTANGGTSAISMTGTQAIGIVAGNLGGNGGSSGTPDGQYYYTPVTGGLVGNGGAGGAGGEAEVTLNGSVQVNTSGSDAAGIVAFSDGGAGGVGGGLSAIGSTGTPGNGGNGGTGGAITITLENGAAISTSGEDSPGIYARSSGGIGGIGGGFKGLFFGDAGNGGNGGSTGTISVTLDNLSSIRTTGEESFGILAQGLSGAGGVGGQRTEGSGSDGAGGTGGSVGEIEVTNHGAITTSGMGAHAIFAQGSSGAGGASGDTSSIVHSETQPGGSSGSLSLMTLTNTGSISTSGSNAYGILGMSLSGGGGSGGDSYNFGGALGGNGGVAANAGAITLNQSGSIQTSGDYSTAVLLQAIGGGGGDGGSSSGIIAIGGSGSGGGAGGVITANLTGGSITTTGEQSHALIAQSIGGGGGNAGNATSDSAELSLAIGGTGGAGGSGQSVTVTSSAAITTSSGHSAGILAQSIGGGGGTGGSAFSLSGGLEFDAAIALGGRGGNGGVGGTVHVIANGGTIWTGKFATPSSPSNLLPVDAYGILAQSIGGGGGVGGASSATAFSTAIPSPETFTSYTATFSYSAAGTGGAGGVGGEVEVSLTNDTQIITQGQGSHGILAQSVGNGGGAGGDSSAMAATLDYTRAVSLADGKSFDAAFNVSLGGDGGTNAGGGEVTVTLEDTASIVTYGDYANGILAQSVGGGGGNAGIGSGNTADFGSAQSVTARIDLGGHGAGGGAGNTVNVTLDSGASILTNGSGAAGIVAQSIGGGGGNSQGSMLGFGVTNTFETSSGPDIVVTSGVNFQLGTDGGHGGNGGEVTVTVGGTITTYGSDAPGVFAQSIAGGGGLAGTAGADASADNPMVTGLVDTRAIATAIVEGYVPFTFEPTITLGGGSLGSSGIVETVTINHAGTITTHGDWSHGILAQSISGGGGKAGSAAAHGYGTATNVNISLGSSTGGNGNSGSIVINPQGGHVTTSGFSAFGLVAQSIGAGGGIAVEGSDSASGTLHLGAGVGEQTQVSVSGAGGNITVNSGTMNISTSGQGAHGAIFQSIGGGGGIVGAGNRNSDPSQSDLSLNIFSNVSGSNGSGVITFNSPNFVITTHGDDAYGMLVQAISGGGGLGAVVGPSARDVTGNGFGSVQKSTLTFGATTNIQTYGDRAHGLVIQSIAGGGGLGGYSTSGSSITTSGQGQYTGATGSGTNYGVEVTLDDGSQIQTYGNDSHGLIVQSLGTAGGIYPLNGGIYIGPTSEANYGGVGGKITLYLKGIVSVEGDDGSVGVFAQSSSSSRVGSAVQIQVEGLVESSVFTNNGEPPAIWIDQGNDSNELIVEPAATVDAFGVAVRYTGNSSLEIVNDGIIWGSIDNPSGSEDVAQISLYNRRTGLFRAGTRVEADVVNAGRMELSSHAEDDFQRTILRGDFEQRRTGTLVLDADFNRRHADLLKITGDARLAGTITPRASSFLPGVELPVIQVEGGIRGELGIDPSEVQSALFNYMARQRENIVYLSAGAPRFDAGLNLSPNQQAVVSHLASIWNAGGNAQFSKIFAKLDRLALSNLEAYDRLLNELSPGATLGFGATSLANARSYGNIVLNGPVFEGETAKPSEVTSTWARMYGRNTQQSVDGDFSDFSQNATMWVAGGQAEVASDLFLGGSAGYQYNWLGSSNVSGHGHTLLGAVTLKYEYNDWLFAGAITGSASWAEYDRQITPPGFETEAHGSPEVQTVGGVLRAAYTYYNDHYYIRPMLSLHAVHVMSGGYTESGGGPFALEVKDQSQTTFIASPGVEFGLRTDFENGMVLRSYLSAEANFSTEDEWSQDARFTAAPASADDFTTVIPTDTVSARVTAGVQLQTGERTSVFVQYEGQFSENLVENGGAVGVKVEF